MSSKSICEVISVSITQKEKAVRFRALHEGSGVFVIPNPWDVASTRILAGLGFQALATSSVASAAALGRLLRKIGNEKQASRKVGRLCIKNGPTPRGSGISND